MSSAEAALIATSSVLAVGIIALVVIYLIKVRAAKAVAV
jgi:hypothetical protein